MAKIKQQTRQDTLSIDQNNLYFSQYQSYIQFLVENTLDRAFSNDSDVKLLKVRNV